jgi:hypothetical protein
MNRLGTVDIAFGTITGNEANRKDLLEVTGMDPRLGGGIYNEASVSSEGVPNTVTVGNTILAGNKDNRSRFDNKFSPDCFSTDPGLFTSFSGNLIGVVNANCNIAPSFDPSLDRRGSSDVPLDPRLGPLANNGGPTQTHALMSDSKAIDGASGNVPIAGFPDCPETDQRGLPRPLPVPDIPFNCDIGAVEFGARMTFQPPAADASLDENSPNTNRGAEEVLHVRSWVRGDFRILVHFDLSAILPRTNIEEATLELCLDRISGDNEQRTYSLHRVRKPWVESEVTANHASKRVRWDTFFSDFGPTTIDADEIIKKTLTSNPNQFRRWDVTQEVKDFVNGAENNGWLIKDRFENAPQGYRTDWVSKEGALNLVSREGTSTACGADPRPRLIVVFP